MYYKQDRNTIYFETPEGQEIVPPYMKNWDDWSPICTDFGITFTSQHARYSVVDKGVWLSTDLTYETGSLASNTNKLWFSLPTGFESVIHKFSNYTLIEKISGNTSTYIPAKIFIDGNESKTICYIENLQENVLDNTTYKVQSNIFYEYTITNQAITSPWQAWYPTKRDSNLQYVNVISARYYKLGTNMWVNFDLGIKLSSNIGIDYKTTYLSLPSGVTSKSLIYSTPVVVIKSDTQEKFIGNVNIGKRITDPLIDENTFRVNLPEGFDADVEYFIQGQMIFEEVSTQSFDFFFDTLILWLTKNHQTFDSFDINHQNGEISNKVKFMSNEDSILGTKWDNRIIGDTKQIHFNSSNGIGIKKEAVFIPYTYKTRSKKPWRLLKLNSGLKFQITMDGIRYMDQFVIYQ